MDSFLTATIHRVDLHQNHVKDLHLHAEALSMLYNQILLKVLNTTLQNFQTLKQI